MRRLDGATIGRAAVLAGLLVWVGCGDDDGDDPMEPTGGSIRVSVATTGDATVTSYSVRLDGGEDRTVEADGSVIFVSIPTGAHDILLLSVPSTCTVDGGSSRAVTVTANEVAQVEYDVTCTDPGTPKPPDPPTGEV